MPDLALIARALSHSARLDILRTLGANGTCHCADVVDALPLAQSTVSQHLRVLREAGLICGTTDGPRSCYCLDADALAQAQVALNGFFDTLAVPAPCCG